MHKQIKEKRPTIWLLSLLEEMELFEAWDRVFSWMFDKKYVKMYFHHI